MKNLIIILAIVSLTWGLKSNTWHSVVRQDEKFVVVEGKQVQGSLAWGIYVDDNYNDGWGKITLHTNAFKHQDEAYAAGFLEGSMQTKYISFHKVNFYDQIFKGSQTPNPHVVDFLEKQYNYTLQEIRTNAGSSAYWLTVELFTHFFEGLVAGFNAHVEDNKYLTRTDFLILQATGDMFDILPAVGQTNDIDWLDLTKEEFRERFLLNTHCSVLLKIKDDLSDVFLGHTSWNSASVMLRTYKFYNFGEDMKMQLTSYPGVIYSLDDYYILQKPNQQLYVTETSLSVFKKDIYKYVTPNSLLCWQRILVTNFLASNGQEWTEIFKLYNSGTYNNQYMVTDTKRFIPGVGAQPGFLWIVEQMPGLIINQDVTDVMINQGNYWSSYNIPYIKEIFEYSGCVEAEKKMGDEMSHDMCPRAQIFRREQSQVQSIEAYKKILRLNKFQTDPLSQGDPTWVIAARGDLYPKGKELAFFAYDAKATSYLRIVNQDGLSDIQNGPTHDDQPKFKWSNFNFTASHEGHADEWNFDWIQVRPEQ